MSHPEQPEQNNPARGDIMHPDYEQWLTEALAGAKAPFDGDLITHTPGTYRNREATFFELEGHPDAFIRQVPENIPPAELKRHMDQFEFMRQSGIKVPKYSAVISHSGQTDSDPGSSVHYLVTQKVTGTRLPYLRPRQASADPHLNAAIDHLSRGIVKILQTCADTNHPVPDDLFPRQFIYGKTATDSEPDLYMVDIDPMFEYTDNNPEMKQWVIETLQDTMSELDRLRSLDQEVCDGFRTAMDDFCERNLSPDQHNEVITRYEIQPLGTSAA